VTRRTILITGASSGLGAGMAREFAARGHDLALCARRAGRLEQLQAELARSHPDVRVLTRELDVTDHAAVFEVFTAFDGELGGLDRVIVNAGLGKGQPVGTGRFDANLQTLQTNLVGALAQCEAAMGIFRAAGRGHLVVVSSVAGLRGGRRNLTAYAASKAGVASLAEGIRSDVLGTPIKVTTLFPGYIESEMTARAARTPFLVPAGRGARALADAIEREPAKAVVPAWPWLPLAVLMRIAPLRLVRLIG
jgi:short-subunit dehydrogenase